MAQPRVQPPAWFTQLAEQRPPAPLPAEPVAPPPDDRPPLERYELDDQGRFREERGFRDPGDRTGAVYAPPTWFSDIAREDWLARERGERSVDPSNGIRVYAAQQPPPEGPPEQAPASVLADATSSFLPSLWGVVKDTTAPIHSPIQTARGLWGLAKGLTAMALPGEQSFEDQTANVEAVANHFKDRYGSREGFERALRTDPAGVLADIAGLASGGSLTAVKVGSGLAKAGRAAAPVVSEAARTASGIGARAAGAAGRGAVRAGAAAARGTARGAEAVSRGVGSRLWDAGEAGVRGGVRPAGPLSDIAFAGGLRLMKGAQEVERRGRVAADLLDDVAEGNITPRVIAPETAQEAASRIAAGAQAAGRGVRAVAGLAAGATPDALRGVARAADAVDPAMLTAHALGGAGRAGAGMAGRAITRTAASMSNVPPRAIQTAYRTSRDNLNALGERAGAGQTGGRRVLRNWIRRKDPVDEIANAVRDRLEELQAQQSDRFTSGLGQPTGRIDPAIPVDPSDPSVAQGALAIRALRRDESVQQSFVDLAEQAFRQARKTSRDGAPAPLEQAFEKMREAGFTPAQTVDRAMEVYRREQAAMAQRQKRGDTIPQGLEFRAAVESDIVRNLEREASAMQAAARQAAAQRSWVGASRGSPQAAAESPVPPPGEYHLLDEAGYTPQELYDLDMTPYAPEPVRDDGNFDQIAEQEAALAAQRAAWEADARPGKAAEDEWMAVLQREQESKAAQQAATSRRRDEIREAAQRQQQTGPEETEAEAAGRIARAARYDQERAQYPAETGPQYPHEELRTHAISRLGEEYRSDSPETRRAMNEARSHHLRETLDDPNAFAEDIRRRRAFLDGEAVAADARKQPPQTEGIRDRSVTPRALQIIDTAMGAKDALRGGAVRALETARRTARLAADELRDLSDVIEILKTRPSSGRAIRRWAKETMESTGRQMRARVDGPDTPPEVLQRIADTPVDFRRAALAVDEAVHRTHGGIDTDPGSRSVRREVGSWVNEMLRSQTQNLGVADTLMQRIENRLNTAVSDRAPARSVLTAARNALAEELRRQGPAEYGAVLASRRELQRHLRDTRRALAGADRSGAATMVDRMLSTLSAGPGSRPTDILRRQQLESLGVPHLDEMLSGASMSSFWPTTRPRRGIAGAIAAAGLAGAPSTGGASLIPAAVAAAAHSPRTVGFASSLAGQAAGSLPARGAKGIFNPRMQTAGVPNPRLSYLLGTSLAETPVYQNEQETRWLRLLRDAIMASPQSLAPR